MHHTVKYALERHAEDLPIRADRRADGYYHLHSRTGERRVIGSAAANTVLANADWPTRGGNVLLWMHARPLDRAA